MSIPIDKSVTNKPALNDAELLATLSQREQDDNLRTQQMMQGDQMHGSMELFAFIMALFTGLKDGGNQQLFNGSAFEQLSSAFGLNSGAIRRGAESVFSGHTDPRSAARSIYSNIDSNNVDWSKAKDVNLSEIMSGGNAESMLHPTLVERMENDPQVRQMVKWTMEAAERNGLDGNLLANQYWQESRFNPRAISSAGAIGVAQFMPHHVGKWGLASANDLYDPKASIDAGARFMKHLTNKLGGSQELALVAYNGDFKAIDYADKNVAGDGVTIGQWMGFMEHERATKGVGRRGLWRNETYGYIKKICPQYWDKKTLAKAEAQQSELKKQFAKDGVKEEYNDKAVAVAKGADAINANKEDVAAVTVVEQEKGQQQPEPQPSETGGPTRIAEASPATTGLTS